MRVCCVACTNPVDQRSSPPHRRFRQAIDGPNLDPDRECMSESSVQCSARHVINRETGLRAFLEPASQLHSAVPQVASLHFSRRLPSHSTRPRTVAVSPASHSFIDTPLSTSHRRETVTGSLASHQFQLGASLLAAWNLESRKRRFSRSCTVYSSIPQKHPSQI